MKIAWIPAAIQADVSSVVINATWVRRSRRGIAVYRGGGTRQERSEEGLVLACTLTSSTSHS